MKTLLMSTAAALTLATGAFAQSGDDQLRLAVADQLDGYDINVDVSSLSDEQIAEIYAIGQSEDDAGERAQVMAVLGDAGYQQMELGEEMIFISNTTAGMENAVENATEGMTANSLRDQVDIKLGEYGFDDVDAATLTDDQVAKLYTVVQNSDTEGARAKIETILQ